jgi:LacI family transcriptional regulator
VSFVLNGVAGASISQQTRERVLAAADELGFRPNQIARSLRSRTSDVLGLITYEIATTPYAVAIIKGAQEAALGYGKTLLIIDTDGEAGATADAISKLNQWRVDGLVIAAEYHREVSVPEGLGETRTIFADCYTPDERVPCVVPDERQGGLLATRTLLRAGHRRIGFVNGPDGFPASAGRLRGYLDAHAAAGLPVDERLVRQGDWWQESGARHAADLLDLPDPPTALFCGNDWMAMGAYDVIKERGLRIPDDVAVIGFDNRVEVAAHLRPALTSVALPYHDMGRYAVEYLLAPRRPRVRRRLLRCPLIRRESV